MSPYENPVTARDALAPAPSLLTSEVLKRAGVTARQLNHWIGRGYIPGQGRLGSGRLRGWTQAQFQRVLEVRDAFREAAAILRDAGLDGPADWLTKGSGVSGWQPASRTRRGVS